MKFFKTVLAVIVGFFSSVFLTFSILTDFHRYGFFLCAQGGRS